MALISINPRDPRSIYVQIVDEVRRALIVGTLRSDDALPSVRQLASDLGINPNTVKQAYHELERLGIATVRRGEGTFVAHRRTPDQERPAIARAVAARAVRDALRHGLSARQLIDAIEVVSHKELTARPARKDARR